MMSYLLHNWHKKASPCQDCFHTTLPITTSYALALYLALCSSWAYHDILFLILNLGYFIYRVVSILSLPGKIHFNKSHFICERSSLLSQWLFPTLYCNTLWIGSGINLVCLLCPLFHIFLYSNYFFAWL